MSDFVVLISGHMGSGKTTGIQSVSEIEVISTEAKNHDKEQNSKATTTVALDYGSVSLGDDIVKLYGLPGQRRFSFLWTAYKKRASCMLLLVANNSPRNPIEDAIDFLEEFDELRSIGAVCVGITHYDVQKEPTRDKYDRAFKEAFPNDPIPPIFTIDPRKPEDMQMAILATLANTETNTALKRGKS